MLADLVHRSVPVHGIGFQGHFEVGNLPSSAALRSNFQRFGDLGLKVHVTELDVRIPLPASASELQQQGQDYRRVMEACLDVPACEMVVTWGFTDRYSWVPGTFPGFGAALLLTEEYQPKHAYWGVHGPLSDG
jgi:endo-1,4-beta-xylanase